MRGYSEKCKRFAKRLGVDLSACKDIFLEDAAKAMGLGPGERLTLEMIEEMADCEGGCAEGGCVMNNPGKRQSYPEGIACNQEEDVSAEPFAVSVAELLKRTGLHETS